MCTQILKKKLKSVDQCYLQVKVFLRSFEYLYAFKHILFYIYKILKMQIKVWEKARDIFKCKVKTLNVNFILHTPCKNVQRLKIITDLSIFITTICQSHTDSNSVISNICNFNINISSKSSKEHMFLMFFFSCLPKKGLSNTSDFPTFVKESIQSSPNQQDFLIYICAFIYLFSFKDNFSNCMTFQLLCI